MSAAKREGLQQQQRYRVCDASRGGRATEAEIQQQQQRERRDVGARRTIHAARNSSLPAGRRSPAKQARESGVFPVSRAVASLI